MSNISIIVNTPKTTGNGITIVVQQFETVSSAKEKYYAAAGSRVNNQWLYYAAVLKDSDNFDQIGIEDKDIIEAHPSSKGGN